MSSRVELLVRFSAVLLAAGTATSSFAQTTFVPQGGEYRIIEALPGDQIYPHAAINSSGGFVVWQDAFADGEGLGINAQRLDGTLSGMFGRFRVNQEGAGDQENARVALFANGAAAFAWQGGDRVDSDIFVRFMGTGGTFITGDIRANTFASGVQKDPVMAVLSDGNLIVVWSSQDQDGSMQGIFGQRFTATGQKIGEEFQVNQFTQYNQRNPAVAALAGGSFAVAWVSELQRLPDVVDIYARVFDASGAPAGNEFRVNTVDSICAHPAVSAGSGAILFAWSQKDLENPDNGWDVFARSFSSPTAPMPAPYRVNAHTFGDQFQPRLNQNGESHLVVWTSMGQDGSFEGIYSRGAAATGTEGEEMRVNTRTVSRQVQPAIASNGQGKILVVWSGFGAVTSFDLYAQRYDALAPIPLPSAPNVFALDGGSLSVTWPELMGFPLIGYEVYINGNPTPIFVTTNTFVLNTLAPGSAHSIRISYVLADGRRSTVSQVATGTTWGADLNGDGLPDDWQKLYWGKDPAEWPNPDGDADGDGATNRAEFLAGTNPVDANSVLRSGMANTGGQMRFNWNTEPGMIYQVQRSTNLVNWINVGPARFSAGNSDSIVIDQSGPEGYYRVIRVR